MIEKVGVIGGGLMGSGITEVCARAGLDTVVVEVTEEAAKAAETKVRGSLERAASRGKITEQDLAQTLERITVATELGQLKDRDLVVEAASEREDIKLELFRQVGALLEKDDAVLTSNTSSIPIVKLGAVSGRAAHVMGVLFFNPAPGDAAGRADPLADHLPRDDGTDADPSSPRSWASSPSRPPTAPGSSSTASWCPT
ncbi:hypothetical protein JCM18899A_53380 [Nocardioides sp. AN3]